MQAVNCRVAVACNTDVLQNLIQDGYASSLKTNPDLKSADVLVIDVENLKILHKIDFKYQYCFLIFDETHKNLSLSDYNNLKPNQILPLKDLTEHFILKELEAIDQQKQDEALLQMSSELQNQDEQRKEQLQQQIFSEQQELIERRLKILESNTRTESLRKILFSLSEESDIARIETLLNELIPQCTAATWIKVIPEDLTAKFEEDLKNQLPNFFSKRRCSNYFIYFVKGDKKPFRNSENEMFLKVSDALHFNLLKSSSLAEEQQLEKIVSTAFNSTFYPLLIVDRDYNIVESNKAFHRFPATTGKCYQVMFNRESPCKGCQFGHNFQLQQNDEQGLHTYNVQSQRLVELDEKNNHWVHFYADITEEKLVEQRLSQTAKMKELGLISSSIAHELNNPLGGILSYLQILQMELAKTHPLQAELKDLVQAGHRMKHIIENLLVFSRRPSSNEKESFFIRDLITETLKMNELSFKVENIKVIHQLDQLDEKITVAQALFRDSLNLIFNFFIEGVRRQRLQKNNFAGLIEVKFSQDQINFYLDLQSNIGPLNSEQKTKNIYFLIIHKSLMDQGFQVELTEPNSAWVSLRVTVPKQD